MKYVVALVAMVAYTAAVADWQTEVRAAPELWPDDWAQNLILKYRLEEWDRPESPALTKWPDTPCVDA